MQHVVVIVLVVACVALLTRQAILSLRGKGKLGNCCSRGCGEHGVKKTGERLVFLPAEMLKRK